jgi:peroxiredoxin
LIGCANGVTEGGGQPIITTAAIIVGEDMVLTETTATTPGAPAPAFSLRGVDGKTWTLDTARGKNGLVVMFICNHCPYVKAVREKMIRDARDLAAADVGVIAVNSNDPRDYPEDSFDNMQRIAREFGYPFPYVFDETQETAKSYGAVCTPEFFGYDRDLKLRYHGRLDAGGRSADPSARRELFEAMKQIAQTGQGPKEQMPSIGCSIKWRTGANR